jgi:ectoine hydroxylase-related dioxygenase (phytanoyl-CoA dioxygenase family)
MPIAEQDTWQSQYESDGYGVLGAFLSPTEVAEALTECDRLAATVKGRTESHGGFNLEAPEGGYGSQSGGGASYPGVLRKVQDVVDHSAFFRDLSNQPRFIERVQPLVGRPVELKTSVLWYKPAHVGSAKPWHQDAAYLDAATGPYQVSVWIALDAATEENGCLQFLPRSHSAGAIAHEGSEPQLTVEPRSVVVCELAPGAAVLFSALTLHASEENRSPNPRRAVMYRFGPA